jgi:hypothetical protein
MSVPELKLLNGKGGVSKGIVYALVVLSLVAYIAVQNLTDGNKSDKEATQILERMARLEECVITLRPLPAEVAGMKATLDGVQSHVDNIEKKLDNLK